ncbi:AAA family ATPase [Ginsengibacter hankyongi]|uniref:AAA family ATPase n=1 Tax=Ginsengibacter hankyongi TaxID=2607284 RepID=A0A5J5IMF2_9BACT|nr:adenylate/guanylate cyclase domain-containing protein [Ginsengibacter hankyongi]KAA9041267.1 AAA family ATPase [Ginsengibacter hankyongi]
MIKNIDHSNVIHYGFDTLIIKTGTNGLNKPSCIKVLKEEFPSKETLAQLENEFEICYNAKCNCIRKAFKKETQDDHLAIILEYIEGQDLGKILNSSNLNFTGQCALATDITSALTALHQEKIFHRRIHPGNILIEQATNKVFFIDFGLATEGNIINEEIDSFHEKEIDVLRYIAPEQTGRINRSIDIRADLYSLGIILYRLFTGELPFESSDGLELIYSHIAKTPVEPYVLNKELPKVISDIIMKLLAKNAEDRYQSAFGVKYDLEKCLEQLLETGKIENFPIANFDFSGKLYFSEKLYGREKEITFLNELFENCTNGHKQTLLVSGYSGSGKSALVEILKNSVSQKNGIFIKGKFDQISSDTPYSTFVQAFNEMAQLIMAGDNIFQAKWKKRITDALGNSGKLLTQFMPGIETLIGRQTDVPELKGLEAQNRFNYEFTRFIKAIADKDSPLVIFVDDLQWADASSLNLFKIIAENRDIEYVMLAGGYRKNEVDEKHVLTKKLSELKEDHVAFDEIDLQDLSYDDVFKLISDALSTRQENISFLADIIYNKTKGNAFYVRQFLKSIYDEGFLHFDFEVMRWQWNTDLILQMNVSGNVVELMTSFILKLPDNTLDLLKIASSIGNRFSKRNLSVIKQISEKNVESLLKLSVTEGLIIPSSTEYKFAHDRIQQTIYSLIPDGEKAALHLLNGQRLSAHFNEAEFEEKLFELVNQWNLGAEKISEKKQKLYLANLNLTAGHKAIASTAYPQALQYFEKGLNVLDEKDWETQYDLLFQITTNAADAAYLSGQYDKVDQLVNAIFKNSKSLIDSAKGYEINIKKLIAQNKPLDAVELGLTILKKFGIDLPLKPGRLQVMKDLLQTKFLLRNKTMDYFNSLPEMKDAEKNAAMRILSDISSASFFAVPSLVPLLVFKMVSLTVKYGLSRKSPFSFAAYGYILSVYLNEVEKGIAFGEIALHLAKKINAEELFGSIMVTSNIFLNHWKKPFIETINDLDKSFKSALESGDNEYASYAAHNTVYQLFMMGYPLHELSKKAEMLDLKIEKFKQDLTLKRLRVFRQSIANLIQETEKPDVLTGNIFDEAEMDIIDVTKSNEIYFQNLYLQKLYLALVFNLNANAKKYLDLAERFQESVKGTALYPLFYYYRSLLISDITLSAPLKREVLAQITKDIHLLKKYEKFCPQNYSHKIFLLEAEFNYLSGDNETAKVLYDKALKFGTENGMTNDLAYCWERAGRFFVNTKQELLANFYLQNAYRVYKRWGADAKLTQMEKQYSQLRGGGGAEWQIDLSQPAREGNGNMDLESVLKASSVLSGEIILPKLLKKMMQIILENAGAQTGFLIMEKKGERYIEAEIKAGNEEIKILQSVPVSKSDLLAESVLNYVYMTQETVILDDACKSPLFGNDSFIKTHECKSILCIPLLNMGKIQAVIYLANDLTSGAFTEKRVGLLKLLAGQMAISIENALFYSELEHKVEERTNELRIEKKKSDDLLLNILPEDIANELKQTGNTKPRSYEVATVMFTDFENFTSKSEKLSPEELVAIIDTCFKKFDEIISKYNIEKIKTIGDAYLCVSGLPDKKDHSPVNVVKAAIEIVDFIYSFRQDANENSYFDIRIGIHTGPLVAGVVGDKKFAFDIWGDTVNTASRMEQNSEANKINISQSTYDLVKDTFHCKFRGKRAAKNKGMIEMYFVERD